MQNASNGGNGIINVWEAISIGLVYPKRFVPNFLRNHIFLGRLTKLFQTCVVKELIIAFEQLSIHTKDLSHEFYIEWFISGLNKAIKAHVQGHHPPNWL